MWSCTVDDESGEMRTSRISPKTAEIVKRAKALPGEVEVAYEAGPTGFGPQIGAATSDSEAIARPALFVGHLSCVEH